MLKEVWSTAAQICLFRTYSGPREVTKMLILLSPAKTLNMEGSTVRSSATRPCFAAEALKLVTELQKLSVQQLKTLLGVSDAIAQ